MTKALLLSIRVHLLWFFEAFGGRGRSLTPLGSRRLVILLLYMPAGIALQACHWIGFFLDEVFFRKYRRVTIKEPLIVTGIPRSGTTFLHRTLARDTEQFTTLRTWEVLLAPSITERKLIRALARLDNRIGRPLHRLVDSVIRKLNKRFENLHEWDLTAPAEDFLTLLPAGGCFFLVFALPASRSLWQVGRFQEVPDHQRAIWIHYYQLCLRKHLYCVGSGKRLLSKNSAFGSWLPDLRIAFPDARFIFCIRQPNAALSSQLSSLRGSLEFFGTLAAADLVSLEMQTVFAHVYRILLEESRSFLVDRLAVIDHSQFKQDTAEFLETSLKKLCIPVTDALHEIIQEAGQASMSHACEYPATPLGGKSGPSEFNSLVDSIYNEILSHPCLTFEDRNR